MCGPRDRSLWDSVGGDVNGIRSIAGGLGIAAMDNNASFITQLQVMF